MARAGDVHLSEAELALLDETATLARHALAPIAAEGDEGRVNVALLRALGARGLLARVLRPDVSAMDLCLIREGLARGCTEAETAFAVTGDSEGLRGERIDLVSPHPIGRLRFERVQVPGDHRLGEVGGGFRVA